MPGKIKKSKTSHHKIVRHAKAIGGHLKDHVVPHARNGHRPHVLKHGVLFGLAAVMFGLKVLAITVSAFYPSVPSQALSITPTNVLELVNQDRLSAGLKALKLNSLLMSSAQAKAEDMAKDGYFAHTSPSGLTPWYFIKAAGYAYARSAENLAVHYQTAEQAEGSWMASPTHRSNIMNPVFVDLGVGVARGIFEGADTIFVVQHFGQPFAQPLEQIAVQPTVVTTAATSSSSEKAATTTAQAPVAKQIPTSTQAVTEEKVIIKTNTQGVTLGVTDSKAVRASVSVGEKEFELKRTGPDHWAGELAAQSLEGASSKSLTLAMVDAAGKKDQIVVAVLNEGSPLETSGSTEKLWGRFGSDDFQKLNRMVGAFILGLISLALAAYAVVRFHVARPKVIGHAVVTMALVAFLMAMK